MRTVGVSDYELRRYQKQIGAEEYRRQYQSLYLQTKYKKRYSGKVYENSPEKIKAIKEKYKNGITNDILEEINGELTV